MSKEVKYIDFPVLMEEMKYLKDDRRIPKRDDPIYKGIESIKTYQFNACIMFEMAIRNKDVIETKKKLDFLDNLKNKYPYIKKSFLNMFENGFDNENDCANFCELPLSKFKKRLTELIEINNNYLDFAKCKSIFEYLQNKLKEEFFIYPNQYIKGYKYDWTKRIVDSSFVFEECDIKTDRINPILEEFKKLKPSDMKAVADLFFMYDYNSYRVSKKENNLINQDIKIALTKYHGVKIKGTGEVLSYTECLEKYEYYKSSQAGFSIVERAIRNKIDMMKNFIDNQDYQALIFIVAQNRDDLNFS